MNDQPILGVPFSALVDHMVYLPVDVDKHGNWRFIVSKQGAMTVVHKPVVH